MNARKIGNFASTKACRKIYVLLVLVVHLLTSLLASADALTYTDVVAGADDARQLEENYVLRPKRPIHRIYPSNYESDKIVKVVPGKRAALLLDRIMVALQKAVDDGSDSQMKGYYAERGSGLQRRDQDKGKVYWRCYFNAVTCF